MIMLLGLIFSWHAAYAQPGSMTWTEDFDGTVSFTMTPVGSWVSDPSYSLPGSSVANPKSYLGLVPNQIGNTTILQTPQYDFTGMTNIILQFSHICKVSPSDTTYVQYRFGGTNIWVNLEQSTYMGKAWNYGVSGFNAASYNEWLSADSTATPSLAWWREETFDLRSMQEQHVDFRFVIKRGQTQGSQTSYGWLLENFQIKAAPASIDPPVVEFVSPFVKDTVYNTGPWEINAKVARRTNALIVTPWLKYMAIYQGAVIVNDSVLMTRVAGDSLWKGTIPQFEMGTDVAYFITGIDMNGNKLSVASGYVIDLPAINGDMEQVISGVGGNTNAAIPFSVFYGFGWSHELILSSEINSENTARHIISLAYYAISYGRAANLLNQTLYLKAVPAATPPPLAYIDPIADGATLVWQGTMVRPTLNAWMELPLIAPFTLPAGSNLMVYWENRDGTTQITTNTWRATPITNMGVANYDEYGFPTTDGAYQSTKTDIRFTVLKTSYGLNSVAVPELSIYDSVTVTPGTQIPIVVNMKNKGETYLDSVIISYTLNGAAPVHKTWYGHLPWDFNTLDTLGYYTQKVNGYDTLVVWVSLPNGVTDPVTGDDTLRKVVYGMSGIFMNFVTYKEDTVYETGPFAISARITALAGNTIGTVSLNVITTNNGTVTPSTLPMTYSSSDNLWKTSIPNKPFGSDVAYSITLTDMLGNVITIAKSYYVKPCGVSGICPDPDEAALVSINTPGAIATSGVANPVLVTLRNIGANDLLTCTINWTINGIPQPSATYHGNLPSGFTDTITIGSYIPVLIQSDAIVIWVELPNGIPDLNTSDDTLRLTSLGCISLSGIMTIGSGGDFTTINSALNTIRSCGMSGDLTLQLMTGTFAENVSFANFSPYMNGHTLTLTSVSGVATNSIIRPTTGVGIILTANRDIIIRNITVDVAHLTVSAIQFTSACTNIVIRECRLLGSTTSTTSGVAHSILYKGTGSGLVDSIFIIKNDIIGGYNGFYFYGGTSSAAYGKHVVFDSNTVENQYGYATYPGYTDFISFSYNTILSRTASYSSWDGLRIYYCNGAFVGNKIVFRQTTGSPRAIYCQYFNYYQTTATGLLANNMVIMPAPYRGIYLEATHADILHNSVYMTSSNAASIGLYIYNSTSNLLTIKNNNIVVTGTSGYPIYFSGTGNLTLYDIDYNNYRTPTAGNVGYYTSARTLATWKTLITTDQNSVNVAPSFVSTPSITNQSMKLSNNTNLVVPTIALAGADIDGILRLDATATMGAYEMAPINGNAALTALTGLRSGTIVGQNDNLNVVVFNTGATTLTSINLTWYINGVPQDTIEYPLSLIRGAYDTIPVGTITYTAGSLEIMVRINNLNLGGLTDAVASDDTVRATTLICAGAYSGLFTIGATGDFTNIAAAFDVLNFCGVNGDITLAFETGSYPAFNLANTAALFGSHTLTLTSLTGNVDDVTIATASGAGITLSNCRNVVIKDMTIDVHTASIPAIQFASACTNIVVRDCKLLGNQTTTTNAVTNTLLYKATNTGVVDSIFIIHNLMDGGYYGFYFNGGTASAYGANVVFDSNTVQNQYYYAIYPCYTEVNCSYNTVSSRTTSAGANWQGLRMYYCNGDVIGNRIHQLSTSITSPYGIYCYYHNHDFTQDTALLANNEIMLAATGAYAGIYVAYAHSRILHNSIYMTGNGAANGIQLQNQAGDQVAIQNNNIVMTSPDAYPVYFSATGNGNGFDVDYNNYDAPAFVGYYGADIATLAAWQQAIPTDRHSVQIAPDFINPAIDLQLGLYNAALLCPLQADAAEDINGIVRLNMNAMGAYTVAPTGQDLMLLQVDSWNNEVVTNQTVPVSVVVFNSGAVPITNARLAWTVNGNSNPTVLWTPTTPLAATQQQIVSIGSFVVTNLPSYDVLVWIDTINGIHDTVNWHDTVFASATVAPLAKFVAPFVGDTIHTLSFAVNVELCTVTGAPVSTPTLTLSTSIHDTILLDTITMVETNGIWTANVPQQYYGSTVIYSLTVEDGIHNTITLTDTTYIDNRGGVELYTRHNLAILSFLEPVNTTSDLCPPDFAPVTIVLTNLGEEDYDFSQDAVLLNLEVIAPLGLKYTPSLSLHTGTLRAGASDTIDLMSALPVMYVGTYTMTASVASPIDRVVYDDTLFYTYVSGKIGLPIDEDFSVMTLPMSFVSIALVGANTWTPYTPNLSEAVQPDTGNGTGVLRFNGTAGAMSLLTTRQLDLYGTSQPKLEFWYYHDAALSTVDNSYTEVNIIVGNVTHTVLTLYKKGGTTGWEKYTVPLTPFAGSAQCVVIEFESMNKYAGSQYIDRIIISSEQDLAVSEIIINPTPTVCSLKNTPLDVVIRTTTRQAIDFSINPTTIAIDVQGQLFNISLQGQLAENTADTLHLPTGLDLDTGRYTIKAYITTPVDDFQGNDTAKYTIDIRPALSVMTNTHTTQTVPLDAGTPVYQIITLKNTGNVALSNIRLRLYMLINAVQPAILFEEPLTGITLYPGDSLSNYTLNHAYTIPWNPVYGIMAEVIGCDSEKIVATSLGIVEYANTDDLELLHIDTPSGTGLDTIGSPMYVKITLRNNSMVNYYQDVKATIELKLSDGTLAGYPFGETIEDNIPLLMDTSYTFKQAYTVPDDSVYTLTVFITDMYGNPVDHFRTNDTARVVRRTVRVGDTISIEHIEGNAIGMEQNIPNPAKGITRIAYSLPTDGEVTFRVYTVSGQELFTQVVETTSGKHRLELNTTSLASGVYFYSMEFKGQRIVKRMSVHN
jgi:hypothetical protein